MRALTTALCAAILAPFGTALAQPAGPPPIEKIDFYGLRTISEEQVRALLPFAEGDPAPAGPPPTEDIAAQLGVESVVLTLVCCGEAGGAIIYVGVAEEGGGGPSSHREAPTGDVRLPDDVATAYGAFTEAMEAAVRAGNAGDDFSQGHSLVDDPTARALQEQFIGLAARDRDLLVEVLRDAGDARHRAAAATVLAYAADKPAIVGELTRAVDDPDEGVRNNATRALMMMAMYVNETSDTGIVIDPAPFLDMLDSIVWSDRNKSVGVLWPLTERRDPALMARLRERSMPALTEMCRWKNWGHAMSACMMLQRALGLPDDADPASREATLAAAETAGASR